MTLEISFRLPFTLPRLFRAQNEEPLRKYYWVGEQRDTKQGNIGQPPQNNPPREKKPAQQYRLLSSITLGEVEYALRLFEHQRIPSHENWIGKNHFCKIALKRKDDGRPPVVFGRVSSCYPSDGQIENIEDVEMLFPRKEGAPDLIHIHKDDIKRFTQTSALGYYIGVAFKASAYDAADLEESGSLFAANGFFIQPDNEYYDLLEMNHLNRHMYPMLYVIGSRWFDSVPDSVQAEMCAQLERMLGWGKIIINYHPDWLPKEINALNKILGYKNEFTPIALTEPANPQETAFIVNKKFSEAFTKGFASE